MVAGLRGKALTGFAGIAGLLALLGSGGCFSESMQMDAPAEDGSGETGPSGDTAADSLAEAGSDGEGTTGGSESGGTTDALVDTGADTDAGTDEGESTSDGADKSTDDDATTAGSSDDAGEDSSTGVAVLGMDDLLPGDLVITEVMWNPGCTGDNCEWFEIYNATDNPVNLLDLHVQDADLDASDEGRITKDIIVESGGYAVLTRDADAWNYELDHSGEYGPNPGFNNSGPDFVAILDDAGNILDESPLFPDGSQGVSWTLWIEVPDAVDNDDPLNWCFSAAETPLVGGEEFELGSPLEPGPDCL